MRPERLVVGCFICGRARQADHTVHATCGDCGATLGMCKLCSFSVPAPRKFLAESIEWHQQHGRCSGRLGVQVDAIVAAMRWPPGQQAKAQRQGDRAWSLNHGGVAHGR